MNFSFKGIALAVAAIAVLAIAGAAWWYFTNQSATTKVAGTPAIIYDLGGKHDKSFNQAAYAGAEAFKTKTGVDYVEFEIERPTQREQAARNFARRGHSPVIAIGFQNKDAIEKVAKEFPDIKFAIIDDYIDLPNVRSDKFKEHEGSYLVGIIAGLKTNTGKVGFVGGMDIPLISKFACGYKQGVLAVNPAIEVFENMTGTTPAAFNDPTKGQEIAISQFDRGADIVFAAAGNTGTGVLQAAADKGKFSIGVDSNQNYVHPGSVLTSMVKRVDLAVEKVMTDTHNGNFQGGLQIHGLAEGGVGYSLDEHNQILITPAIKKRVEAAEAAIILGEIAVHDYTTDNTCPF